MTHYIGPKQKILLAELRKGRALFAHQGKWTLQENARMSRWEYTENRERCMGLYTRGFIMADSTGEWGTLYILTEKGKKAVEDTRGGSPSTCVSSKEV